jgi:hypothetical protein
MNDAITKETTLTVGLDLGDRYIQGCVSVAQQLFQQRDVIIDIAKGPIASVAIPRTALSGLAKAAWMSAGKARLSARRFRPCTA